jgi:hypothetical protein
MGDTSANRDCYGARPGTAQFSTRNGSLFPQVSPSPSFQVSRSRGSYLNVGCGRLWIVRDYFANDVGYRTEPFVEFDNRDQVQDAANIMATQATSDVESYRKQFPDKRAVYEYYSAARSRF